ncbi:MAG: tetratricopeptide repeat protein [Phycisphaerae bacterium]
MSTSRGSNSGRDDELIAGAAQQVAHARRHEKTVAGSGSGFAVGATDLSLAGGESIPGYQIIAERQRGGQGVVYEAIQRATRRRVAIKVLHERQVGGASRARFEREVEILAQLRHPNIVTIHDSSQAGTRLYYVMDLIDGVAFDEFAAGVPDRSPLRILPVFQKVCEAVNAAHLRGVMHRDLKPSNILVDRAGEPRVLDFGLAKSLDPSSGGSADMTETGQFLGSMMWASPEQVEAAHDRLDIRCDVYSLGVILFHSLTGQVPYPSPHTVTDVARHIRETEPLRPSAFTPAINDELETIVLKCLQKDPDRRYQSAGELGRDIGRYLAHEPIEAKRDSVIYQFRKRLRRHRAVLGVSAMIMLVSTVAAIVSAVSWREAERQRARAEDSERIAARKADESRRVADFQAELLGRLDPESMGRSLLDSFQRHGASASGDATTARDPSAPAADSSRMVDVARETITKNLLDPAELDIEARFAGHPAIEAQLRDTLAKLYRRLGRYPDAERNVRRSLALRREMPDEDLSDALNRLAVVMNECGNIVGAEVAQRDALAYAETRHGPRSAAVAIALDNLAGVLGDLDRRTEGEQLLRRALAIWTELYGEQHPDTLTCLNGLAIQLMMRGELAEAETILQRVLDQRRVILPATDPLIAASLRNLARVQYGRGGHAAAEANSREALRLARAAHGNDHPEIAESLNALAIVATARGDLDSAEQAFREAITIESRLLGPTHPTTTRTLSNLGRLLNRRGEPVEAAALLGAAHANWTAAYGTQHTDVARTGIQLAEALLALGEPVAAEVPLCGAIAYYDDARAAGDFVFRARVMLARALIAQRRFDEAECALLTAESDAAGSPGVADVRRAFTGLYDAWREVDADAAERARATTAARPPAAANAAPQP